jgi:DnaK suppressor protein
MTARNGQLHRDLLLTLRARLLGEMNQMADAALNQGDTGSAARMPTDLADLGTDAFEQELTLSLMGNGKEVLEKVEAALKRIEDGSYGRCEDCGKEIPKARLDAIPYVELCVKCASREEQRQDS